MVFSFKRTAIFLVTLFAVTLSFAETRTSPDHGFREFQSAETGDGSGEEPEGEPETVEEEPDC